VEDHYSSQYSHHVLTCKPDNRPVNVSLLETFLNDCDNLFSLEDDKPGEVVMVRELNICVFSGAQAASALSSDSVWTSAKTAKLRHL